MKIALTLPGSTYAPAENLATPSGIPSSLGGDLSSSGALFFQTGVSWLLYIAATLAILMLMWGGIQWITSSGNPEKLASAKKKITLAIIGLVIALSAFFIVRVVITVLGGNSATFFNFGAPNTATSSAILRASP